MSKKNTLNKRQLATLIKQKYPGCTVNLLNESSSAYVLMVHNLVPWGDPVIMIFYRDANIPMDKSFDFYTKNQYFAIPI